MANVVKRPKRLKNIHVEEVSFVNAGANRHRLVLKSEEDTKDQMEDDNTQNDSFTDEDVYVPTTKSLETAAPAEGFLAGIPDVTSDSAGQPEAAADTVEAPAKQKAPLTLVKNLEDLGNFAISAEGSITDELVDALEVVSSVANPEIEITAIQKSAAIAIAKAVIASPRSEGEDQKVVLACIEKMYGFLADPEVEATPASVRLSSIAKMLNAMDQKFPSKVAKKVTQTADSDNDVTIVTDKGTPEDWIITL